MRLRVPHPRQAARERQAAEQARLRKAVARSGLRGRTPQTRDPLAEYRERQERRWVR